MENGDFNKQAKINRKVADVTAKLNKYEISELWWVLNGNIFDSLFEPSKQSFLITNSRLISFCTGKSFDLAWNLKGFNKSWSLHLQTLIEKHLIRVLVNSDPLWNTTSVEVARFFFQCTKNKMRRQLRRLNEFRVMESPLIYNSPLWYEARFLFEQPNLAGTNL